MPAELMVLLTICSSFLLIVFSIAFFSEKSLKVGVVLLIASTIMPTWLFMSWLIKTELPLESDGWIYRPTTVINDFHNTRRQAVFIDDVLLDVTSSLKWWCQKDMV